MKERKRGSIIVEFFDEFLCNFNIIKEAAEKIRLTKNEEGNKNLGNTNETNEHGSQQHQKRDSLDDEAKELVNPFIQALLPKNQALCPVPNSEARVDFEINCYGIILDKMNGTKESECKEVSILFLTYRLCFKKLEQEAHERIKAFPDGKSICLLRNLLKKNYIQYHYGDKVIGVSDITEKKHVHAAIAFTSVLIWYCFFCLVFIMKLYKTDLNCYIVQRRNCLHL